jgi:predicted RNA-binding Zn-ribbon protein involved in translation (DUF1610 family)
MKCIKMKIIKQTELSNKTVLQPTTELDAVIKGEGDTNYACANCGKVLIEAVNKGQVKNIVIKCPVCGEYNLP